MLAGVEALVVLVPLSTYLSTFTKRVGASIQGMRDERGRLIGEAVSVPGSLTLKTYGWVEWARAKITAARAREMGQIQRKQLHRF